MDSVQDEQLRVLRWLQAKEGEGGDPYRVRDSTVMEAFGWAEKKAKAVLRVLKERGDIDTDDVFTTGEGGYSVYSIRLTGQGHRRLDPVAAPSVATINVAEKAKVKGSIFQAGAGGSSQSATQAKATEVGVEAKVGGSGRRSWWRWLFGSP
ncbi:MAG TPA: hypothetical protein VI796_00295 [Candidatus Thermoplasmatota archaeon]|nr:hypothetical protein [Candidatus Thermoplasmatota archaeon]